MPDPTESSPDRPLEIEQLTRGDHAFQILCGVLISSGLLLLWTMETARNYFFRVLDRLHITPRRRTRGSAFPAGTRHP